MLHAPFKDRSRVFSLARDRYSSRRWAVGLFLLLSSYVYSEIQMIQGDAARNWLIWLDNFSHSDDLDTLRAVNSYFNEKIAFASDLQVWDRNDYWATPMEMLGRGAGDCEDFSIGKYISLRRLGIPNERLRLIYTKAELGSKNNRISQAHMVLGYYATPMAQPLILDNLISSVLPAGQRDDLKPIFSFNSSGLWAAGARANSDPTARLSRWREVLSRLPVDQQP